MTNVAPANSSPDLGQTSYELPPIRHAFDLTEEQEMVREMVRDFATAELEPNAHDIDERHHFPNCLLYTSPSPRDRTRSRMPSSA